MRKKAMLMLKAEEDVKQFLFSGDIKIESNSTEKEIHESECYTDRWRLLQFKLKQILLSEEKMLFSNCNVSQQNTLVRYPKIQLPTFNGD